MSTNNVALIVGVTGIVGSSLVETLKQPNASGGPWKIYGIAQRAKPEWLSYDDNGNVHYIQCDLLDKQQIVSKVSSLQDVTHIFWVAYVRKATEEESCEANGFMFRTLLDTVLPVAKKLSHICLQTGTKHYLGPYSGFVSTVHYEPPFEEDMPRHQISNFYYTLEDILMDTCASFRSITWSVHRPNIILGFAPRNNFLLSLAKYAAICKKEGLSFIFPGDKMHWERLTNMSDSLLIAEQELWTATDPRAKNQAFNIDNGDLVSMKKIWHVLGKEFNLEVPEHPDEHNSLVNILKDKEHVWDEIVTANSLVKTDLNLAWYAIADLVLSVLPVQIVTSMNKSKEHGFLGFRNTVKSVSYWIKKMKDKRLIPGDNFWA